MAEKVLVALRIADVHGTGLIPRNDLCDILLVLGIDGDLVDRFQISIQADPGASVDYAKFVHWLFLDSVPERADWYRVIALGGVTLRQHSHKPSPSVGKLGQGKHFAAFERESRGNEAWLRAAEGWVLEHCSGRIFAELIVQEPEERPTSGHYRAPRLPSKQHALADPPATASPALVGLTTPPEATIQVEGALGDLADCNGPFMRHKLLNGKHKYRNTANQTAIIFFDRCWKMREVEDPSDWCFHLPYREWALHDFHTQSYEADVPLGVWLHKSDANQSVRVFERKPPWKPPDSEAGDVSSIDGSEAADSARIHWSPSPSSTASERVF